MVSLLRVNLASGFSNKVMGVARTALLLHPLLLVRVSVGWYIPVIV